MVAGTVNFGTETASGQEIFKAVAVIAGRFALSQGEDVGQTEQYGHERGDKGHGEGHVQDDEEDEKNDDARADAADEPPKETAFQTPGAALGIGRGVGVGETKFGFHGDSWRMAQAIG